MEESGDEGEYEVVVEEEEKKKIQEEETTTNKEQDEYTPGYNNSDVFEMAETENEGVFVNEEEEQLQSSNSLKIQEEEEVEKRAKSVKTPMHDKQNNKEATISPPQVNVLRMDDMKNGLCNKAKDLLIDLKRSDWLPMYDEDGVRSVCEEVKQILNYIKELGMGIDPEVLIRVEIFTKKAFCF